MVPPETDHRATKRQLIVDTDSERLDATTTTKIQATLKELSV